MIFKELLTNISLIITMVYLYGRIAGGRRASKMRFQISMGILFGAFSVIAMIFPVSWTPGLIFDGRSILLSLAGFFGGFISGILAVIPALIYRAYLGGFGALAGMIVIVNSVVIGVIFNHIFKKRKIKQPGLLFYTMGLFVHLAMILMMLTLPGGRGPEVFGKISIHVMVIYPIATLLIGLFIIEKEKQIEYDKALHISEEKFRALAENSMDVIMRFDRNHRHLYANPAVEVLTGIPRDNFLGKTHEEVGFSKELCEVWGRAIEEVFLTGKNKRLEFQLVNGNWIDWLLMPELDEKKGVQAVITSARDMSESKKVQEMLIQNEKMISMGNMAAGMAHEINNPLGVILLSIQNTFRRLSEDLKENREQAEASGIDLKKVWEYLEKRNIMHYLEGIKEAGEKASEIVKNMLGFVRAGNLGKENNKVEEIMDHAVELLYQSFDFEKRFDFKHLKVIKEYVGRIPLVPCIRIEIEQVFFNLLKNAAQALIESENTLEKIITISIKAIPEAIIVSIADNGKGIPLEIQNKLFEPFFTTKGVGQGTGLGLSICYFIINQHHQGEIRVESIPNHGANFIITLPL